jgi:REP element-mobilizing transposase RayT
MYVTDLAKVVTRFEWFCLAYCLMPNHIHLLLQTPLRNLGRGMQRLQGRYAQTFNRRHHRVGHLFQGRYGAVAITDDEQLATAVGYIAVNPVVAGLVERPEGWRWASHRAMTGEEAVPAWLATRRLHDMLAGVFGGDGAARYRELVEDRLAGGAGVAVTASDVTTGAGSGSAVL